VTANGKITDMCIVKYLYKPVLLANSPRPKVSRDFGSPFAESIPVKKKKEKLPKSEFRK
jgi:hypothetical protein